MSMHMQTTPAATSRAERSLTGLGKENKEFIVTEFSGDPYSGLQDVRQLNELLLLACFGGGPHLGLQLMKMTPFPRYDPNNVSKERP